MSEVPLHTKNSCSHADGVGSRIWDLGKLRVYRGTSLIRNSTPLGPNSRTMHRAL